ncbi:PEROXIDASE 25-RELATED [Salix viminalis]|uniref:Peroxidase n=1 Tax=Salix viminalis TaxID=40686 RepID=A0A9Q0UT58_SALVM|nr:PEROXIDASE 25-RELATED [Salix viminalis]
MAGAASSFTSLLLISSLFLASWFCAAEAQSTIPVVNGLSWTFYKSNCPKLESIVRKQLQKVFKKDIEQAAGLLRLHFHDCFVQGCDGSVLLDGSASGPSEQDAPPNLTLRAKAFEIIEDLRDRVEKACGRVVSCSDILALAARDSVYLSGGPDYDVPLGRRDGFDATDVVALSGGHTIGISHCSSFTDRLYPTQDTSMDKTFANNLKKVCPTSDFNSTTVLDIRSPNKFDNKYYVDLMNRQGLFTSDQDLYTNKKTRGIVTSFAVNQSLFFDKFVVAMIKMSQLKVLTGNQGEVRASCSARNSGFSYLESAVEKGLDALSELV